MIDNRINETFSSIYISDFTSEPVFADGDLVSQPGYYPKMVHSTNTYYKKAKTWSQIIEQHSSTPEPIYFTYGIGDDLNLKVYAYRELNAYTKISTVSTGASNLLRIVCNVPPASEQPEVKRWRKN